MWIENNLKADQEKIWTFRVAKHFGLKVMNDWNVKENMSFNWGWNWHKSY